MTKLLEVQVRDVTFLSFRLEGRDPFDVPQAEWAARAANVRRSLKSVPK
jgi:hypothetical protein